MPQTKPFLFYFYEKYVKDIPTAELIVYVCERLNPFYREFMRTLSESKGIGGEIKASANDFIVKEITEGGIVLGLGEKYSAAETGRTEDPAGDFTVFVLQKSNWNTIQALQKIAKLGRRGIRSVGYAGMKDRLSTSTQLASIFGVAPEFVSSLSLKDISINGAWKEANAVEMGDLLGNAFSDSQWLQRR